MRTERAFISMMIKLQIYFLFLPECFVLDDLEGGLFIVSVRLPCVAPPPAPLRRFPVLWPKFDLSDFFIHRSGSGGGVTPGTTPLGTRDNRTFFAVGLTSTGSAAMGARVVVLASAVIPGGTGGGFFSSELMTDAGSASRACRYPLVSKSRCV